MKKISKLGILVLLALVIFAFTMPFVSSAAEQPIYPTSIAGLPVIFVQTPDNTITLPSDSVVLTLMDDGSATVEESVAKLKLSEYLSAHPLPKGWNITICGGPEVSKEKYEKNHQKNNEKLKMDEWLQNNRQVRSQMMQSIASEKSDFSTTSILSFSSSAAAIRNTDCSSGNNVDWQHIEWYAPDRSYYYTDAPSMLINNGYTNTYCFIQTGQWWGSSDSLNFWTDLQTQFYPQTFVNVEYIPNDLYGYNVFYDIESDSWIMSCTNYMTDDYEYVVSIMNMSYQLVLLEQGL